MAGFPAHPRSTEATSTRLWRSLRQGVTANPSTERRGLRRLRRPHWLIGVLLSVSGTSPILAAVVETQPEPPALRPPIHTAEKSGSDYVLIDPFLPPMTTTRDGRIGLMRKRFNGPGDARFHLFLPEKINNEFLESAAGAEILGPAEDLSADELIPPHLISANWTPRGHLAICDPKDANPKDCTDAPGKDCYHLDVISAYLDEAANEIQLWSTPIKVVVSNPKDGRKIEEDGDPTATIESITVVGDPVPGEPIDAPYGSHFDFHTPMIVGDNRLLVVRIGPGSRIDWKDNNGVMRDGRYDTVYSHYSGGKECDVKKWEELKPILFAHKDSDLEVAGEKLYPFTEYPFRSASGASLNSDPTMGPVKDLGARYIWMDFDAKNLFFGALGRKIIDETPSCKTCVAQKELNGDDPAECYGGNPCRHLYDLSCVSTATCDPYDTLVETEASFYPDSAAEEDHPAREQAPPHMGWSFLGLWSHGKMVLLDSMFNNTDSSIEAREAFHREAALFDGLDYRIGAGRTATVLGSWDDPLGWPATTVQFGSPEHLFNMVPNMRPRSPRDVVWLATAGGRTDEIVFDDYLDRQTLIFSPMNALFDVSENMNIDSLLPIAIHPYYDGLEAHTGYREMRLQNAATTTKWNTPAYGQVIAASSSTGRIENFALGGIKGRGFFLFDGSKIQYDLPAQDPNTFPNDKTWVVSLFVDLRVSESPPKRRRLFTFEGGGWVDIHGYAWIRVCESATSCEQVFLPKYLQDEVWTHLALEIDASSDTIRFFQDGFLFAEMTSAPGGMELFGSGNPSPGGELIVGSDVDGVQGWIDELRVVEGPLDFEVMCNHANGTMLAVPPNYNCDPLLGCVDGTQLDTILSRFTVYSPSAPHDHSIDARSEVHRALYGNNAVVTADSDYYLCHVDYGSYLGISVNDSGDANARSVRRQLQFPEGSLLSGELRPDSASNGFCLSCHHSTEKGGLTVEALELLTSCPGGPCPTLEDDVRRQPSQAPSRLRGNIPADYFAVGKPDIAREDMDGVPIDPWLHDGPAFHWTFDEGAGTSAANIQIGDPEASSTDATLHGASFKSSSSRRTSYLELDAGLDGVGDDLDHAIVDEPVSIDSGEISLSAWFRLGGVDGLCDDPDNVSCHAPEDVCRNNLGGGVPCTVVAKAEVGEDWLIRIANVSMTDTPSWRIWFILRVDGTRHVLYLDAPSFNPREWHHVAATYDGDEMKIYLDGGITADASESVGSGDLTNGSNDILIGARLHPNGTQILNRFYGLIDDVRIYNRALLGWEVDALASSTP